ncbi:MAG: ABC transporter permease [Clostridia bacterium]|nr:ABC transporter permease [Clostridia bacterium]
MLKYAGKRILMIIPTLILIIAIIFVILSFIPSSPGRIILGMNAKEEQVIALNEQLGWYDSLPVKFIKYLKGIFLEGDFGDSYKHSVPVFDLLLPKFGVTALLALLACAVSALVGIPSGILSAVKKHSVADGVTTVLAMLLGSVPSFFLGVLMILIFSLRLGWLPSNGIKDWTGYIMPVLTLALPSAAYLSRMTRTTMLEALEQDYIRTARAKGCKPSRIIFRHALRNALMPVVTQLGMSFAGLLGGAMITEQVFGLPGFSESILSAIQSKDVPVIMGSTIFIAAMFMVVMLVVDLLYAVLDPRVGAKY